MNEINDILELIDNHHFSSIMEIESGKSLRSVELKNSIKLRVNNFIENYGLKSGHSVILQKNNSISFFVDFLALYFLRVTAVPLDSETNMSEVNSIVNSIKPVLLINEKDNYYSGSEINKDFENISLILFTSGSTSRPKGVMLSRTALEKKIELLKRKIGRENIKNTLCFVPTFFGHGLICNSLFPLFCGENFFVSKKMTLEMAANLSDVLVKYQINFFSSVPGHWEMITKFGKKYEGNDLKRVHSASSLLKVEKIPAIISWLGNKVKFYDIYGATEMSGWFASREITAANVEGQFNDFWDLEQELSSEGELLLKSGYMFEGYWQEGKILRHQQFNTGDIFTNSILSGRTKNVININGIKVQCEDISSDLMKSTMLTDAAVFPVSDNFSGERIGVAVVLKSGFKLEDLWGYCRKNMSPVKIPSEFLILDKIPLNTRGKVSSVDLVEAFQTYKNDEEQVLALFNKIFKTKFTDSDVKRSLVPDWDSMRHAELVIKIQEDFKINFAVKDILHIDNLKDLVSVVSQKHSKLVKAER